MAEVSPDPVCEPRPAALPWYRCGGLHLVEVGHAVNMLAVQGTLAFELLPPGGPLIYACATVLLMLYGQRPAGGVSAPRWFFVTMVFPAYFATLLLLPFLPRPLCCSALALALAAAKIGICMSVCLHRYASHAAFKCGGATSLAIQTLGCLASQGGALWWAANHRCHHKFCDSSTPEKDPHSPKLDGQANAFAFLCEHQALKEQFVPRHCDGPIARLIDTWAAVPCLLEMALMHRAFGTAGLWVAFVSGWLSQVCSLRFNVTNHLPDPTTAPPPARRAGGGNAPCIALDSGLGRPGAHIRPPNLFFTALDCLFIMSWLNGESSHHHHHSFAALAHRPGCDLPFHLFVRPLHALGLIWDVQTKGRDAKATHTH